MARIFAFVLAPLMGVLLVIGFIRMAINPSGSFLPSYEELIALFNSFPDITKDFSAAVASFQNLQSVNAAAWADISDVVKFFAAVGSFFQLVGGMFAVAFEAVKIPFSFLYWFITTFMGGMVSV